MRRQVVCMVWISIIHGKHISLNVRLFVSMFIFLSEDIEDDTPSLFTDLAHVSAFMCQSLWW